MADDRNSQATSGRPLAPPRNVVPRADFVTPEPVPADETSSSRPFDTGPNLPPERVDYLADQDLLIPGADAEGSAALPVGVIVAVVLAVLVAGLGALALIGDAHTDRIPALRATGLVYWLAAAVVVIVAVAGGTLAEVSERATVRLDDDEHEPAGMNTGWIIPMVVAASSALLMATFHNAVVLVLGALLTLASILIALVTRDLLDDLHESAVRIGSLLHGLMVHLVAFVALSMIYLNKFPEWASAAAVAVVSGLLILESLQRVETTNAVRLGYAAVGGLVLGECAVAINWWLTWDWTGGIALLVCFFLVSGLLCTQAQQRGLRSPDIAFYAGLSAVALIAIAWIGT